MLVITNRHLRTLLAKLQHNNMNECWIAYDKVVLDILIQFQIRHPSKNIWLERNRITNHEFIFINCYNLSSPNLIFKIRLIFEESYFDVKNRMQNNILKCKSAVVLTSKFNIPLKITKRGQSAPHMHFIISFNQIKSSRFSNYFAIHVPSFQLQRR